MNRQQLSNAYQAAEYWVLAPEPCLLHIGEMATGRLATLIAEHQKASYIITAENPGSIPMPTSYNNEQNNMLADTIRKKSLPYLHTISKDPTGIWPDEHGFLLLAIDLEVAISLAVTFGQCAIVRLAPGQMSTVIWAGEPSTAN